MAMSAAATMIQKAFQGETPVPPQGQDQPGHEHKMTPQPQYIRDGYKGSDKLKDKVAIISGGDSGIGRAVAVHFAREGADVAILYLSEHKDAQETQAAVQAEGRRALLIPGDAGLPEVAKAAVEQTVDTFGRLDIVVNNCAEQHMREDLRDITPEELHRTFQTNIYSYFYLTQAALDHLKPGSTIINTTSINAYRGHPSLAGYSSTKGAILAFTRSIAQDLIRKGIRVNGVAPGPIWTPLIPATFPATAATSFGSECPMGRPGQPSEVAPAYVFLASEDSSYFAGQVLHPNGGTVVNA